MFDDTFCLSMCIACAICVAMPIFMRISICFFKITHAIKSCALLFRLRGADEIALLSRGHSDAAAACKARGESLGVIVLKFILYQ